MSISAVIGYTELSERFNKKSAADVRQYLDEKGIAYDVDARGRPWTTLTALDIHLGLVGEQSVKSRKISA